jgi:hypothetical protein
LPDYHTGRGHANVAELIKDHVTLEVRCLDRPYLNAYVPRLQSAGGVIDFLGRACGQKIASPAIFGQITRAFKATLYMARGAGRRRPSPRAR